MNSDLLFFGGIFLFIFLVWVYTGGPSHPISFAGPYLTPITNVDGGLSSTTLSKNSYIQSTHSSSGTGYYSGNSTSNSNGTVPAANRSTYYGLVDIRSGNISTTDVRHEYIVLHNDSSRSISISGWQLVSSKSGSHVTLPQGQSIINSSGFSTITLRSGDDAIVSTASSPLGSSFRETSCTGYLINGNDFQTFSYTQCPYSSKDLRGLSASDYDQCSSYVDTIPRCTVPNDIPDSLPSSCRSFIANHLTYSGCVADHSNDSNFYGNTWHVYLNQRIELWQRDNDTIILLDGNGKVVDRYTY